jgi:hypothetical protein
MLFFSNLRPVRAKLESSVAMAHILALLLSSGCATAVHPPTALSPGSMAWTNSLNTGCEEPPGQPLQGHSVPGRKPDSEMPWELFLGNAAHRLIAYMYSVNHPGNQGFYNKDTLAAILRQSGLGDPSRLLPNERELRPDITDTTPRVLFEIKPWNDRGLLEGRQKAQTYLAALNRATSPNRRFSGGTDFRGEILIRFAQGHHIWRLEWQTTEPGVVQYRWTRSQERFASEADAYQAGQWVNLTEHELRQYGGWVGQAIEEMQSRHRSSSTWKQTPPPPSRCPPSSLAHMPRFIVEP